MILVVVTCLLTGYVVLVWAASANEFVKLEVCAYTGEDQKGFQRPADSFVGARHLYVNPEQVVAITHQTSNTNLQCSRLFIAGGGKFLVIGTAAEVRAKLGKAQLHMLESSDGGS